MKKKIIWIGLFFIALLVLSAALIFGVIIHGKEVKAPVDFDFSENRESTVLPVSATEAKLQDFPLTVKARGIVLPGQERNIKTPFKGRIKEVRVRTGQHVQSGQVLFFMETEELEIQLKKAEDDLLLAQSRLAEKLRDNPELANKDTENIRNWKNALEILEQEYTNGDISFEDYADKHAVLRIQIINSGGYNRDLREVESGIRSTLSQVIQYKKSLSMAEIISPVNGIIGFENLYSGMEMHSGDLLAIVYHFDTSKAVLTVLEKDISKIKQGQDVKISIGLSGNTGISGKVSFISPVKNSNSGGYEIHVTFYPHTHPVFKGMFVEGDIVVDVLEDRIVIPAKAVLREGERYYVFVIAEDLAFWRWVEIGVKNEDFVAVLPRPFTAKGDAERTEGVDPGELIAVEGHTLLTHKARVSLTDNAIIPAR